MINGAMPIHCKLSKGLQITIPADIRSELGLREGSPVEITKEKGSVYVPQVPAPEGGFWDTLYFKLFVPKEQRVPSSKAKAKCDEHGRCY